MKKALLASAALAALGIAGAAQGAVVAHVTNLGVPNDGIGLPNGYPALTGYTAYLVTMVADPGQVITAVDFSAAGASGKTLTGPFHQYWSLSKNSKTGAISVLSKSINSTDTQNGVATPNFYDAYDSHFVFNSAQINAGDTPNENNDASTAPGGIGTSPFAPIYNVNSATFTPNDGWGQGSSMTGAWGIQGSFQQNATPVAYLVVPDSAVAAAGPDGLLVGSPQVAETGATDTVPIRLILVPEPATASLLALGAIGLVARRRRA